MIRDLIVFEVCVVEMCCVIFFCVVVYFVWVCGKGMLVVYVCSVWWCIDKWFFKFWEFVNEIWQFGQQLIDELLWCEDMIVYKCCYSVFFVLDLEFMLCELDVGVLQFIGWLILFVVVIMVIDVWQYVFLIMVVSDFIIVYVWGGYMVEENQRWLFDYIVVMVKFKLVCLDELM